VLHHRRDERTFLSTFLTLFERVAVDEFFVNSPVSFDEPLLFIWMARMRIGTRRGSSSAPMIPRYARRSCCSTPTAAQDRPSSARAAAASRGYVALSPPTAIPAWRVGDAASRRRRGQAFRVDARAPAARSSGARSARITVVPHRLDYKPERQPALKAPAHDRRHAHQPAEGRARRARRARAIDGSSAARIVVGTLDSPSLRGPRDRALPARRLVG
jgi:hypothetical protein